MLIEETAPVEAGVQEQLESVACLDRSVSCEIRGSTNTCIFFQRVPWGRSFLEEES